MIVRMISVLSAMVLLGGAQAQDVRPELWGGMSLGMTPEEVTTVLMARGDVQRTRMGRTDQYGRTPMNVSTQYGAIAVAGQRATVKPMFTSNILSSVVIELSSGLFRPYCERDAVRVITLLDDLLGIKYSSVAGTRRGEFTNGEIRVTREASVIAGNTELAGDVCDRSARGARQLF